jgi:predicted O-linked N-acetylglucosamine transferase (SPINDLY family)
MKVLYLSSVFPKRSETFVYREVLGLRDKGINVGVASLYPPEEDFTDEALNALASESLTVYGNGYATSMAVAMPRLWAMAPTNLRQA